ncbi:MAG TPA: ABC transporter permease [Candidatus Limnocylindrales bacterium]|nr:ABC transporter permease [Candidatus Limnocylindrales bacterium]
MLAFKPIYIIMVREFKRFFRQKGRFFSALARPLIWLFVIGSGLAQIVQAPDGFSYKQFIFPGILGMVVLFQSMLSSLSTVYDREFGIVRLLLVAPITKLTVVIGKIASGSFLATTQGVILLILAPFLGIKIGFVQFLSMLIFLILTAIAISSLGMLIATQMNSLENFAGVMNFVIFPMFFLSGGLYPVKLLPRVLQVIVYINPLTYGIDLFKHTLLPEIYRTGRGTDFPMEFDIFMLLLFTTVMASLAVAFFNREGKLVLLGRRPRG